MNILKTSFLNQKVNDKIDQKIKNILKDFRVAHQRSEKFNAKELIPGEPIKPTDIFKMALAFDRESRILIDLELAYSEKFPGRFTSNQVEYLKKERERLTHRIRAFQNRQWPSQFRK